MRARTWDGDGAAAVYMVYRNPSRSAASNAWMNNTFAAWARLVAIRATDPGDHPLLLQTRESVIPTPWMRENAREREERRRGLLHAFVAP